jgi:hypothetical protein
MHVSASSHVNMDNESKKIALIFSMDVCVCDFVVIAATSKGNCRIKALTGSTFDGEDLLGNIFKKHVHEDRLIKSMALLLRQVSRLI